MRYTPSEATGTAQFVMEGATEQCLREVTGARGSRRQRLRLINGSRSLGLAWIREWFPMRVRRL
ncbi:hypothetical protein DM860_001211 [Cuscuta australis]|uniref:Uncharacterized protein n=1 Tax=Cuscuta australis TaxID=267555 RepID=A0A328DXI3_9ASTE|nr:hypothetical protein DM860_001211 [Cuscuta australis]